MTKSDLIAHIAIQKPDFSEKQIEEVVNNILEHISINLTQGMRIEIRKFGSFSVHHRQSRLGRNPKTGENIELGQKHVPRFKAGKELRDRVNV